MPELPEVETIVRDLQDLVGQTIKDFKLLNKKTINLSAVKFRQQILNQPIKEVRRAGKNIIIKLSQNYLLIHLKMTGQLIRQNNKGKVVGGHPIINVGQQLPNKFTRAIFYFNHDNYLFFNDVRKFGWIRLLTKRQLDEYLKKLGLEPLSRDFTFVAWQKILASKARSKIKPALLDQSRVVGLGNIYADESLFLAGIRPQRLVKSLSLVEQKKLWQAIVKVLEQALKYRGTSFNNYLDAQGQSGQFFQKLKVYGRDNQACFTCGHRINKIKLAGRGTHWCDYCQK